MVRIESNLYGNIIEFCANPLVILCKRLLVRCAVKLCTFILHDADNSLIGGGEGVLVL